MIENNFDGNKNDYCNDKESVCDEYLKFLVSKTNLITSTTKKYEGSRIDYEAILKGDKEAMIELKCRSNSYWKFKTIFIEPKKYEALKNQIIYHKKKALYINWFNNDKNCVWICDINDLLDIELYIEKNVRIRTPFSDNFEDRIHIDRSLGKYYEYDEIKKKFIRK